MYVNHRRIYVRTKHSVWKIRRAIGGHRVCVCVYYVCEERAAAAAALATGAAQRRRSIVRCVQFAYV